MDLEQCEEMRSRVLRGDGAIGILPVEEIEQMVASYRTLGEAGEPRAWVGLGHYHLDDNGLDWSLEDAAECACRAVALGSVDGAKLLRRVLPALRAEELDDPPHAPAARAKLESLLATDRAGDLHHLYGLLLFHGFGGEKDLTGNVKQQTLAADRGHVDAQFELYVLLSTGTGAEKDEVTALKHCVAAAEKGHGRAAYNLGAFYATGRGVPLDEAKARVWYGRASEAGNGRATATLAMMVMTGSGGEADEPRGEDLFALAEEQGFDVDSFRDQVGI